jgi:GAF domain-containing protein
MPYREVPDVGANRARVKALDRLLTAIEQSGSPVHLGSLLSFRLEMEDEYLGMCNFYTTTTRPFLPDEIDALHTIVKQAAVALYNAKQLKAMNRQREGLQILSDCIAKINEQVDPEELRRYMTQRIGELFEVDSASWAEFDRDNNMVRVMYTWPPESVEGDADTVLEHGANQGVTGRAVTTGEPYVLSVGDPGWEMVYVERAEGMRTSAAIPIQGADGDVIAALVLETREEDAFTRDDIRLIEAVVSQVPIAVQNAELIAALTAANRELEDKGWTEAMGESVAATVHRVANVAGVIPTSARYAASIVHALPAGSDGQAELLEELGVMCAAGERMLAVARTLQSSGAPVDWSLAQTVSLVERAQSVQRQIGADDIDWHLDGPREVEVTTDVTKLDFILTCLLENAVQASRLALERERDRRPAIKLAVRSVDGEWADIQVTDSGLGIPSNLAPDLGRVIVHSNWGGNGIGLFVSGRMASGLGGKLDLVANYLQGATFGLRLPIRGPRRGEGPR